MGLNVSYDVSSGSLVLVELLGDQHSQLHASLLHQPQHPELLVHKTCEIFL